MQVRFIRLAVLVAIVGVAAAGCGKYSISNIRSAKAFQDANALYKKADYKGAVARYEDSIRFNPDLGFAYFFLGNSYDNLYKPSKKDDPENMAYLNKAAEHYRTAIDKLKTATDPKELEVRRYCVRIPDRGLRLRPPERLRQGGADCQGDDCGGPQRAVDLPASWPSSTKIRAVSRRPKPSCSSPSRSSRPMDLATSCSPRSTTGRATSRRRWKRGESGRMPSRTTRKPGTPSVSTTRTRSSATRS